MHIKNKPNALQPQHHTKTNLKYPSQTTDSMDTSSSAHSLSCCTTLLANHSPITLNSKSHLLFRCPTNTHTADLSVGLVHLCGILALLRFYTIVSWQHLSPSVHLLNFPFFFFLPSFSSFSTGLHSLLYSLYSSFSFLFHEALSNSEECTTFTELINYFFHTEFTSSCLMWDTSRNSEWAKPNWIYFLLYFLHLLRTPQSSWLSTYT